MGGERVQTAADVHFPQLVSFMDISTCHDRTSYYPLSRFKRKRLSRHVCVYTLSAAVS